MHNLPERDWKVFKKVLVPAQFRYCERILAKTAAILADKSKDPFERFSALARLTKGAEHEFHRNLTDYRRSTAFSQIAPMYYWGLFSEEEWLQFSDETRNQILQMRQLYQNTSEAGEPPPS